MGAGLKRAVAAAKAPQRTAMEKIDRKAVLNAMPTNWTDNLLTGPKAVLPAGYTYSPRDIEKLLLAIRERVLALPVVE